MWQITCFLKLPSLSSRSPLLPGQLLTILFRDLPPAEQLAQPWYSPFLRLWCQCIDLFWPFPLCQEPPAFLVSTSQIPASLQFCLWLIGFWGALLAGEESVRCHCRSLTCGETHLSEAEVPVLCSSCAGFGVSDHRVGWDSAQKGQGLPFICWLIQKYHPFNNF